MGSLYSDCKSSYYCKEIVQSWYMYLICIFNDNTCVCMCVGGGGGGGGGGGWWICVYIRAILIA